MSLDVNQTLTEKNHAINCNYFNYYTCPSSSSMLLIHYHYYSVFANSKNTTNFKSNKGQYTYHHTLI